MLLLNKTDKIADKSQLLPLMQWYGQEYEWRAVMPLSARTGDMVVALVDEIIKHLPEGEPIFGADELTDQSMRSLVSEIVREKILQTTGEEIPYVTAVVTEKYDETDEDLTRIHCAIFVERNSQKRIVIGKGAERLKEIGTRARRDIENLVGHRVYLELFVKVEENWRNDARALNELGIEERGKGGNG
jgi:GTP-binding protein Era